VEEEVAFAQRILSLIRGIAGAFHPATITLSAALLALMAIVVCGDVVLSGVLYGNQRRHKQPAQHQPALPDDGVFCSSIGQRENEEPCSHGT
jgi:hypothetical protein